MDQCIVKVPAKINLSLDVIGRRPDGYHLLETVMQTIGLYDTLIIRVSRDGRPGLPPVISVSCLQEGVPSDARNTAYRAAEAFSGKLTAGEAGQDILFSKIVITVRKGIPREAGLGGGSADAAGTLFGLNHLAGGVFTQEELMLLAADIGADVPFCLAGGTSLCRGIGEIIEPVADFGGKPIVLVKPDFGISTPWAFQKLDAGIILHRPDTGAVLDALSAGDAIKLFRRTANVLESVAVSEYPMLDDIKKSLQAAVGCIGSLMSGSGTTMFAVFDSSPDAQAAAAILRSRYSSRFFIEVTQTVDSGPQIIDGNTPFTRHLQTDRTMNETG
ncbi:MAG: 4-(cytidine 5'-diphospho)-2-C-methyl-D-erythritol kinase [Saccharofermentanales bacterium]